MWLQVSYIRWYRAGRRGGGGREGESVHRRMWRHGLWTGHEHMSMVTKIYDGLMKRVCF